MMTHSDPETDERHRHRRTSAMPGPDPFTAEIVHRLRRIEGQVRGIQRMLEDGRECNDVLTQLMAIRSGVEQVSLQIVDLHIERCVFRGHADRRRPRRAGVESISPPDDAGQLNQRRRRCRDRVAGRDGFVPRLGLLRPLRHGRLARSRVPSGAHFVRDRPAVATAVRHDDGSPHTQQRSAAVFGVVEPASHLPQGWAKHRRGQPIMPSPHQRATNLILHEAGCAFRGLQDHVARESVCDGHVHRT